MDQTLWSKVLLGLIDLIPLGARSCWGVMDLTPCSNVILGVTWSKVLLGVMDLIPLEQGPGVMDLTFWSKVLLEGHGPNSLEQGPIGGHLEQGPVGGSWTKFLPRARSWGHAPNPPGAIRLS
ncbi:hypothetical protein ACOMHN_005658 [Nucella lapillus]